jgi:MFS family permease
MARHSRAISVYNYFSMNLSVRRFFGFTTPIPPEHRKNFAHLYWDVAFWGILNGSVVNFLGVYCSRIGANPFQMGLLTAIPALMNVIVTMPATLLLVNKPMTRIVPRAALITRIFYLLLVPLPMLLAYDTQIWIILAIVLFQNISGAVAGTMGNAFLAETIPVEYRGQVIGTRSALVAMTTMVASIVVGQILNAMSLASGYQVVFFIGFLGSMASVYHLFKIQPVAQPELPGQTDVTAPAPASGIRLSIIKGPFRRVLLIMILLNVGIFLPQPIFPLYQVQVLHLSDQIISLAASIFSVIQFLISSQAGWLSRRLSFRKMTGIGMAIAAFSTLFFMYSYTTLVYFMCQLVGGIGWAIFNNGSVNYLLENVPADDRPPYLAWYNLAINGAVLLCGLLASQVVNGLGLMGALELTFGIRMVAALLAYKFG